jgi:hypothetical protein
MGVYFQALFCPEELSQNTYVIGDFVSTRKIVDIAEKKENYCLENCHCVGMEYQIPCPYNATAIKMISQRDFPQMTFFFISHKVSESLAV